MVLSNLRAYLTTGVRLICLSLLALLTIRVVFGPVSGVISARSTLNVAAFAFLSLLVLLFLSSPELERTTDAYVSGRLGWFAYAAILVLSVVPYLPAVEAPFLFDDYVHLTNAATESWQTLLHRALLEHPQGGDGFFRPAGDLYYWLTFQWAGWNVRAWHLCGLVIHASNTLLVWILLRRMASSLVAALAGVLVFAWHASHAEAVCWTAATFDLLAVFFCLLALTTVTATRVTSVGTAAAMLAGALACLSKEAAYCLPLLVACLALSRERAQRRRMLWTSVYLAGICGGVFVFRMWHLQGIGGYRTPAGSAMVLNFHLASAASALLLRLWAVLFFPINWSVNPEVWLRISVGLMALSLAFLIFQRDRVRLSRRRLLAGMLFTLCAALPVFPILLIGSDLAGARVLYLPSVGIALVWTEIFAGIDGKVRVTGIGACIGVLLFQLAALSHNELIWRHEAMAGSEACFDAAAILKKNPDSTIYAVGLPKIRDGVYFLGNGFPQCVAVATGNAADSARVKLGPLQPAPGANTRVLVWDDKMSRLENKK